MSCCRALSERSPVRVLESALRGGLARGELGVVCGGAGMGKTAFLVAVALDALTRDRRVLHAALDHPIERVRNYYDEILDGLVRSEGFLDATDVLDRMDRRLRLHSYLGSTFSVDALDNAVRIVEDEDGAGPDLIVVDGYDWPRGRDAEIGGAAAVARAARAELWMSAVPEEHASPYPGRLPAPLDRFERHVDVLVRLEGSAGAVHVRLLKDHAVSRPEPVAVDLNPTTLLLERR